MIDGVVFNYILTDFMPAGSAMSDRGVLKSSAVIENYLFLLAVIALYILMFLPYIF